MSGVVGVNWNKNIANPASNRQIQSLQQEQDYIDTSPMLQYMYIKQ